MRIYFWKKKSWRLWAFMGLVLLAFSIVGCGRKERYQDQFTDVFDTASMVIGYEESEKAFQEKSTLVHETLLHYHKLFDVYTDYPDGKVNIAYGAVLSLWHEKREAGIANPENASLPDAKDLEEAAKHCNIEDLILDEESMTVFFKDPYLRLDVGGIAKGWAVEKAAELLEKAGGKAYLLNIGGNLRAIGKKGDGAKWVCPVQNPFYIDGTEEEPYAVSGEIEDVSLVTSGDYERYFTVDGVRYAHIVDPETKYPANLHRSVTILTKDSGIADALSTALFILSVEDGKELLEKMRREYAIEIEAMWVEPDHGMEYTEHFLKKVGAE